MIKSMHTLTRHWRICKAPWSTTKMLLLVVPMLLLIYPTVAETPFLLDASGPHDTTNMHANDLMATIPLGRRDSDANDEIKDIAGLEAKHHSSHDDDVASLDTVLTATASTTATTTSSTGYPIFPPKSASCQQCQVHYPKLVECNQIANWTLATLPQLPPQTSADDEAFVHGLDQPRSRDASANITVVMPFLQCICPDQGVLGLKSCLTCFKLSSQANNNFLQELVLQNVTTSLKAYKNLCAETGNGSYVPPGHKGASASQNSLASLSPTLFTVFAALWSALGGP